MVSSVGSFRSCQPVLRLSLHRRDVRQDVQPWSSVVSHVTLQSLRLLRRRLQHHRNGSHWNAPHVATRRLGPPLCPTLTSLQGHQVELVQTVDVKAVEGYLTVNFEAASCSIFRDNREKR